MDGRIATAYVELKSETGDFGAKAEADATRMAEDVEAKIREAMAKVEEVFKQTGATIGTSFEEARAKIDQTMAGVKETIGRDMAEGVDRAKVSLEGMDVVASEQGHRAGASLGAAFGEAKGHIEADMAEVKVSIERNLAEGVAKGEESLTKLSNKAKETAEKTKAESSHMGAGIAAGIGGLFALEGIKSITEAGQKAAANTRIMNQEIAASGGAANVTGAQLDTLASQQSALTGIDKEALAAGEKTLLLFHSITNETPAQVAAADKLAKSHGGVAISAKAQAAALKALQGDQAASASTSAALDKANQHLSDTIALQAQKKKLTLADEFALRNAHEAVTLATEKHQAATHKLSAAMATAGPAATAMGGHVAGAANIFDQSLVAAQNLSAVLGTEVPAAAKMVGKALEDPAKGLTALSKAGIVFTKTEKDKIAAMVASGNQLGAQQAILDKINKTVGGAAKAAADPMKQLSAAMEELKVDLGKAFLPALSTLAQAFLKLMPALQPVIEALGGALGQVLEAVTPALQAVLPPVVEVAKAVGEELGSALKIIMPPLGELLGAALGLVPPLVRLGSIIVDNLLSAVQPILPVLTLLVGQLVTGLQPVIASITPVIALVGGALGQVVRSLIPLLPAMAQLLLAVLPLVPPLAQLLTLLIGLAVPVLIPLTQATVGLVKNGLGPMTTGVHALLDPLNAIIGYFAKFKEHIRQIAIVALATSPIWIGAMASMLASTLLWTEAIISGSAAAAAKWVAEQARMVASSVVWVAKTVAASVTAAASFVASLATMIASGVAWAASIVAEAVVAAAGWVASMAAMIASAIAAGIAMLLPFLPIIAILAAVGVAAYLLYRNWDTVFGFIKGIINSAWSFIKTHIELILALVLLPLLPLYELWKHWKEVWAFVSGAVGDAVSAVGEFLSTLVDAILFVPRQLVGLGLALANVGKDLIGGLVSGVFSGVKALWDFFTGIPGQLWRFFANAGTWLVNVGKDLITGLINGVLSMVGGVGKAILDHIPGGGVVKGLLSNLPGFDAGGFIPGSGPQLIMGHGGEYVLSLEQLNALKTNTAAVTNGVAPPTLLPTGLTSTQPANGAGGSDPQVVALLAKIADLLAAQPPLTANFAIASSHPKQSAEEAVDALKNLQFRLGR